MKRPSKDPRKLSLATQTIRHLTPTQLAAVQGGNSGVISSLSTSR